MDLRDHYVQFRFADIYLPDPLTVIYQLHSNELLRGRVVEMSDGGDAKDAFAVVAVNGVPQLLVVPVDRVVIND